MGSTPLALHAAGSARRVIGGSGLRGLPVDGATRKRARRSFRNPRRHSSGTTHAGTWLAFDAGITRSRRDRMRIKLCAFVLSATTLWGAGCGGSVSMIDTAGGGGEAGRGAVGTAGTGGSAGSGPDAGPVGSGGVAGGSAGAASAGTAGTGGEKDAAPEAIGPVEAGPDAFVACGKTHDRFELIATTYDGQTYTCGGQPTATGLRKLVGEVMKSATNAFTLDSCPPSADCVPMSSQFTFSAPGLAAKIPLGAFVEVQIEVQHPWGCEQRLMVRNLPIWDGLTNPVATGRRLYLAASDGSPHAFDDAPFAIEKRALGCAPDAGPSCGETADDYALRFHPADHPEQPGVLVPMGSTWTWQPNLSGEMPAWSIRNLRSYVSGMCDDYWNWAWWVAPWYLPD
jgi:hypothetical protein